MTKKNSSGYKKKLHLGAAFSYIGKQVELRLLSILFLPKQPTHKIIIVKSRIPTCMLTSDELDILDIRSKSL